MNDVVSHPNWPFYSVCLAPSENGARSGHVGLGQLDCLAQTSRGRRGRGLWHWWPPTVCQVFCKHDHQTILLASQIRFPEGQNEVRFHRRLRSNLTDENKCPRGMLGQAKLYGGWEEQVYLDVFLQTGRKLNQEYRTGCSGRRGGSSLCRTEHEPATLFPVPCLCLSAALEKLHTALGGGGNKGYATVPFACPCVSRTTVCPPHPATGSCSPGI